MKQAAWFPTFAVLFFLASPVVRAADSDDTLKYYLSESELIVSGKITTVPFGVSGEEDMPNYVCNFHVQEVFKGDAGLKGQTIRVSIQRFELSAKDRNPLIKQDSECILLLKSALPSQPAWVTADIWFGIQPASAAMARSFERLAAQK